MQTSRIKINISDIFINDDLRLLGSVNILGMNVNIEAELSFSKVECNNIYINIKSFKVLKMNIVNPISKKVFTVSNGYMSGTIGNTGIAVLYQYE